MVDWVLLAFVPWTGRTNRGHHLARELAAAGDRVLWVDPPEPLARAGEAAADMVGHGIWRSPGPGLAGLSLLGQQAWARGLRARVAAWRDPSRRLVALVQAPEMHLAAMAVGADLLVWDALDDWRHALGGGGARLEVAQRTLARRADLVLAVSAPVAARARELGARRVELVPNGCRLEDWPMDAEPAPELMALPAPRLVYTGGIDAGLDIAALRAAADALAGASLLLVGPLLVPGLRPALESVPGLRLLGERPYAELPGVLAAADGCLLPFLRTPFNAARDSLKLYEYLAAGRPVAATETPQTLRLASVVEVAPEAEGPDGFARACARALGDDLPAGRRARRAVAADQAWSTRRAALRAAVERLALVRGPLVSRAGSEASLPGRGRQPEPTSAPEEVS
ncbi:MAG: glycosyltransferase [Planctomycetes bacterium]|nr:glycosyltransferase [Planctomycetota bacterium]